MDKYMYTEELIACKNKNTTDNPECAKYDINDDGIVDIADLSSILGFTKTKLSSLDGSFKIPAGATKTFTIKTEIPSDYKYNLTGEALPAITHDINISVQ